MYTDENLNTAVEKGIFSETSVNAFRGYILDRNNTHVADEENFRLITSFNDVFVVIACILLLLSSGWVTFKIHPAFAVIVVSILSWGLAEFFVLKRKMALPAIVLLIIFVGGVFTSILLMFDAPSESAYILAGCIASLGTWLHWKRFKIPITVAAGAATVMIFLISLLLSIFPNLKNYIIYLTLLGGMVIFYIAMKWDSADLKRETGKSDVAFWLHLIAAPLIMHPVFSTLGILSGNESLTSMLTIAMLYILLTFISIIIDRRAFMVSSLIYVLIALTNILERYGFTSDSFAYVGVFIGFSLLLLSGFWHKVRRRLIIHLPASIQKRVPQVV